MIQLWVIIGLAISATAVSILGATFSILGLAKLFSGAVIAVSLMAAALELSKFVVAAYLHQTWQRISFLFKVYLVTSVAILSVITSMGVFGFLSDAYSSSTAILESETIKLQKLQNEQAQANTEVDRLSRSVDEIPEERISKKLKARAETEPVIRGLKTKIGQIEAEIANAKIKIIEVKQKVGPLIYISKAFNIDIDTVVKYLILIFVSVFDPLAICLVIAFSDAIKKRKHYLAHPEELEEESEMESDETPSLKMKYAEEENAAEPVQATPEAPAAAQGESGS